MTDVTVPMLPGDEIGVLFDLLEGELFGAARANRHPYPRSTRFMTCSLGAAPGFGGGTGH